MIFLKTGAENIVRCLFGVQKAHEPEARLENATIYIVEFIKQLEPVEQGLSFPIFGDEWEIL